MSLTGATRWFCVAVLSVCIAAAMYGCNEAPGGAAGDAAATSGPDNDAPLEERVAIRVAPVERRDVSQLYTTSSTLRADKRAIVTARTTGVVESLEVEEGDQVREGQVVAVLEDDEQQIEFGRSKAQYENRRREFERAKASFEQGLLSQEEYEMRRREHEEARHAHELADLNLGRTRIRAPFSGIILKRHLDVGATVQSGTEVYDLADLYPLYADVSIPERQVSRLQLRQQVRLRTDATDRVVGATIERIAPAVDPATGTVKVTLALEPGSGLRPGAFVKAQVVIDTHTDALVVRRSALVAEGRRWHLFVLGEGDERVSQLQVEPGFEEEEWVEVASLDPETPLVEGTTVVVVGAAALKDGSPVRVVAETEGTGEGS